MKLSLRIYEGRVTHADNDTYVYFQSLKSGTILELDYREASTGTIPMLKTWRMWMAQMATYMDGQGVTMPLYVMNGKNHGSREFNKDDAHDLFTERLLGSDENGKRYSWAMTKKEDCIVAPKSSRLYAMDKMLVYATEKGIKLTIPRKSEFSDLMKQQES